jgi:hypothetical protein
MIHRLFVVGLALGSGFALALTPPPARAADPDVDALLERGVELRRQGRDAEALAVFEEAHAATSSPRALAQVALAHQALGQWLDAEAELVAALETEHPWIERNRSPLEQALATIRRHLAWLEVLGTPQGATVRLNGRAVGTLPLDEPARVVAGDVRLQVSAEGHETMTRTVSVRPGARAREIVRLVVAAPESAVPGPEGPVPDAGRVLFGVPARDTLMVEAGYSALPRATFLSPVSSWFAIGGRVGLDVGLFNTMNEDYRGTLTFAAGLPLRFAIVNTERVAVGLGLTPGVGLTVIDYTNILGAQGLGLQFDVTGEYFAVLLDSSLDVGFRVTRQVTVGGGVEVPAALAFGGGTELEDLAGGLGLIVEEPEAFTVLPVLVGPTFEWRAAERFALAAKVRMGPHLLSGDLPEAVTGEDSRVDFGLLAQIGFIFAL